MSFKPVRTFLEARLLELDSDFEVFKSAFNSEQIGANDYDKRYHIFYGNVQTSVANQNVTTNDVVSATVDLYFKGFRDEIEALDNAMDFANKYRLNCLRPAHLLTLANIKRVVCSSINATPLDTNDNAIKVQLQFSINIIFGTAINLDNE